MVGQQLVYVNGFWRIRRVGFAKKLELAYGLDGAGRLRCSMEMPALDITALESTS